MNGRQRDDDDAREINGNLRACVCVFLVSKINKYVWANNCMNAGCLEAGREENKQKGKEGGGNDERGGARQKKLNRRVY